MGMMASVEALKEGSGGLLAVHLLSTVLIETVDSVIVEHSVGSHEIIVEISSVGQLPLCVVQQFISNIDEEVNAMRISDVRVGSEVVGEEELGLFRSGAVLAE